VERRLRDEGKKLSLFTPREINERAKALLAERPGEFIAKAKASKVVQQVLEEERRRLERKSKHSFRKERPAAQALPLNETHERNSLGVR
jgi:hypothetical protein